MRPLASKIILSPRQKEDRRKEKDVKKEKRIKRRRNRHTFDFKNDLRLHRI